MAKVEHIIEALGRHKDPQSVDVLTEIGTNYHKSDIREQVIKALVSKNTEEALKPMILNEGKGINDLDPNVAEFAIKEILNLKDKETVMKLLDDTSRNHGKEAIREKASSVKALIALSN